MAYNIVRKADNNNVFFYNSADGSFVKALSSNAQSVKAITTDAVEIDYGDEVELIHASAVNQTQVEPDPAVAFSGTAQDLAELLSTDFFFEEVAGSGGGGATGILGISDATGTYTYYSDINSATTAASSGDTIEFFANVRETNAVEWSLKAGVKYQLNGYTYTLDVPTTENAIIDSTLTSTDEVWILNGFIKRESGGNSSSNSLVLNSTSTGKINLLGVHLINPNGYCTKIGGGKINGGTHESTASVGIYMTSSSGIVKNAKGLSSNNNSIYVFSGTLINSYAYSQSNIAIRLFGASAIAINCIAFSNGNTALYVQNVASKAIGCTAYSTAGNALFGAGIFENCSAFSQSTYAMSTSTGAKVNNCTILGSNSGLSASPNTLIQNCTIKAEASQTILAYSGGTFINCSVEGAPFTYGDCIIAGGGDVKIFGCSLTVRNVSAQCIDGSAGTTVYYGNNIFGGNPTLAVGTNVTQGQTSNHDSFGNIVVD